MNNILLDSPNDFAHTEEDRPAGKWMEGYWEDIALWGKRLAIVILIYFGWQSYNDIVMLGHLPRETNYFVLVVGLYLIDVVLVGLFGYFCYRFAQYLERALIGQDQLLLEKAFEQLHRFLIIGLVIAVVWLWSGTIEWITALQIISESNPVYETPLLSE